MCFYSVDATLRLLILLHLNWNRITWTKLVFTSALVLTQEESMSVSLGENVKMSCTVSSGSWTISWYQQKPGGAPQFLLADSTRASGLPSRFTYSKSGNNKYLHINGVTAEDTAVYYCGCAGCGSYHNTTFGGGTKLTILNRSPSPPKLTLLPPSQTELSEGKATLVCLAQGFSPDSITVSWTEGGRPRSGSEVQTSAPEQHPDGTFSSSSLLTVTAAQWRSGVAYSCQLSHLATTVE
uniref:Ig-like domain-containing protein n=1 Tax=Scleropages formosus TaxID=113540 RepID=A0A8C9QZV7_SCLFO